MKKIFSIALVFVLTLGCIFALASCGGPNSDEDKAVRNLTAAGYDVEAVEETLEGFEVDIVYAINSQNDFIVIYYFDEKADAKVFYERFINDIKDEAPEGVEYTCDRDGDMIYIGTEAAIKATNGR